MSSPLLVPFTAPLKWMKEPLIMWGPLHVPPFLQRLQSMCTLPDHKPPSEPLTLQLFYGLFKFDTPYSSPFLCASRLSLQLLPFYTVFSKFISSILSPPHLRNFTYFAFLWCPQNPFFAKVSYVLFAKLKTKYGEFST